MLINFKGSKQLVRNNSLVWKNYYTDSDNLNFPVDLPWFARNKSAILTGANSFASIIESGSFLVRLVLVETRTI